MVRTVCCETYKCRGTRCSNCPQLAANREAAHNCERELANAHLGGRRRGQRAERDPMCEELIERLG
jgi:hypothetical protein